MTLTSSDFFNEVQEPDGWGGFATSESLNTEWLDRLRAAPDPDHSDVDVAVALMDLVHDDLMRSGTAGNEALSDADMRTATRTLAAVTKRCGHPFILPFRDHAGWKTWWVRNGAHGSWQARRVLLSDLFDEITAKLLTTQDQSLDTSLADSISPYDQLGWPQVDTELGELRRHFREAKTPQDYRAVGNDCVHVFEALSAHVYSPVAHTPEGEADPPVKKTKQRIERYITQRLPGADNAALRRLARSTIEVAQQVKHSHGPTRSEAGIAADGVILLANMLRRLDQPEDIS